MKRPGPSTILATLLAVACAATAQTAAAPVLAPWSGTQLPTAWRPVGLPPGKAPLAQMELDAVDGSTVLRLQTQASYGTLVHDLKGWAPGPQDTLQWRWRLERPLANADLRRKDGDDAALKVCVLFDLPLERVPFVERSLLRLARSVSGQPLPAATVCYVWDVALATGTTLPNAYSRRVRTMVLDGADSQIGPWRAHQQRVHADFLRLFGDESTEVPPVLAIAVGADADNTGGSSLAYIADLRLGR